MYWFENRHKNINISDGNGVLAELMSLLLEYTPLPELFVVFADRREQIF